MCETPVLLKNGANPNSMLPTKSTALIFAAVEDNRAAAYMLPKYGADPNVRSDWQHQLTGPLI